MSLSKNNRLLLASTKVTIILPRDYDDSQAYPAVFVNDSQLSFLGGLADSMILVGLRSRRRIDDYTPWPSPALRSGVPDFGGQLADYHQRLFGSIYKELANRYHFDRDKQAYGGYSLGGLAAVSSLYEEHPMTCLFSICGSFWYPGFVDYCRGQEPSKKNLLVYLQNGEKEGEHHTNRLFKAPDYAREVHQIIKEAVPNTVSRFDAYGHHQELKSRYETLADWLLSQWQKQVD